MSAQKFSRVEKINYKGWENCCRLSNGIVDLVVTTDVGPRIIRFGFAGEENEFKEYLDMLGKTGGGKWRIYGGHRLWLAPEDKARTYVPDNTPVKLEEHEKFVRVIQPADKLTGIQKEMDISLFHKKSAAKIVHRLVNTNNHDVELAPWALSVMAPGGTAILPLPPHGTHEENLLPSATLALWAYTDMTDARWTWGSQFILLNQHRAFKTPQKIGLRNTVNWMAYARMTHVFVKLFTYMTGKEYPDFGSSVEVFTDLEMLELETLGCMTALKPGKSIEHGERWMLLRNAAMPKNDKDVEKFILPKVFEASNTCKIPVPAAVFAERHG